MKIFKTETDNIFFAGDIHGDFDLINTSINHYKIDNCCIIICGDIGMGFQKEKYYNQTFTHISKSLKKRNVHLYMFRGNHDDPKYFDGEHFKNFEYIHLVPDYSVIQSPSRNILCVGGGISIDRTMRKICMDIRVNDYMRHHTCTVDIARQNIKQTYWENEQNIYDEHELSQLEVLGVKIDTVCTHTGPSFTYPLTKESISKWIQMDGDLEKDLNDERHVCDLILNYLKEHNHPLTNWYYGHFHYHKVEIIDGVKYTLLDMNRDYLDLA